MRFSAPAQTVAESVGSVSIEITVFPLSAAPITVPFSLSGTASGADHDIAVSEVVITGGQASATLTFGIIDDALTEGTEILMVSIGAPVGATKASPDQHTVTITDNDVLPTVQWQTSAQNVSEGAGSATVTAALSATTAVDVTVPFTVSGTAGRPSDHSLSAGNIVIFSGELSGSVNFSVVDDSDVEGNESVVLNMGAPTNATIGATNIHTVTIADNDSPASVSFGSATASVSEGAGSYSLAFTLNKTVGSNVSVPYTITGTASNPADHNASSGTLLIPSGSLTTTLDFTLIDDSIFEGDETIVVTMGSPTNAALGSITAITLTITDNEIQPTVSFTASTQNVDESVGSVSVSLQLNTSSSSDIVVPLTVSGTATNPDDHNMTNRSVTITAGQTSGSTSFAVVDDDKYEADETVIVTVGSPTGAATAAPSQHTVTIFNNDTQPEANWSVSAQSVGEGAGTATVTVQLNRATGSTVSIPYTVSGSAANPADHNAAAGVLEIAAGSLSADITVTLIDDALVEGPETILLTMGIPTNAIRGATQVHTLTISDNEAQPVLNFASAGQTVIESVGTVTITATLSTTSNGAVSAPFVVSGTASRPADHNLASGTLNINAGATSATINITVEDDSTFEGNETVIVTIGSPTGATIGGTVAHTVAIEDNESLPTVGFTAASQSVAENVGTVTVSLALSYPSVSIVQVPFTVGGSASNPSDHNLMAGTVSIAAGATTGSILFNVVNDSVYEALVENVRITLGSPTNSILSQQTVQDVNIVDDESAPAPPASFCDSGSLSTTCTISTTKNLADGAVVAGSGDLVVANGGRISGSIGQSFAIAMSGTVTVNTGGLIDGNVQLNASALTIANGGTVHADAKGFAASAGTGVGTGNSGGGHGGAGASYFTGTGGTTYGSHIEPITHGSGGMQSSGLAGAGGGAIKIFVTNTLTVNGELRANGGTGTTAYWGSGGNASGGGAGGSIWISTSSLLGSGSIFTRGGNGGNNSHTGSGALRDGGAGGGGRIAIYSSNSFPGTTSVAGGSWPGAATQGTLFLGNITNYCDVGSFAGDCTISSAKSINNGDSWSISGNLTVTGTGSITHANPSDVASLSVGGTLTMESGALIDSHFSTLSAGTSFVMNGSSSLEGNITTLTAPSVTLRTLTGNVATWSSVSGVTWSGTFTGAVTTLTIGGNWTVSGTHTGSITTVSVGGNAVISGTRTGDINSLAVTGSITVSGTNNGNLPNVTANSMTINNGAFISANGYGFASGSGTGTGTTNAGAGHGGAGSPGFSGSGGAAYGSQAEPITAGAGGANGVTAGGAGGGIIKIFTTSTLSVNGILRANGMAGSNNGSSNSTAGGGGAGGSIWLQSAGMSGTGSILAQGGNGGDATRTGNRDGGAGGGGRIAIYSSNSFGGTVSAAGGTRPAAAASPGGVGTLFTSIINPCDTGSPSANCTISSLKTFGSQGASWNVIGDLTIANGGFVENSDIGQSNSLTVTGNLVIQNGGMINANLTTLSAANITIESTGILTGTLQSISTTGTFLVEGFISGTIGSITADTFTVNGTILANTTSIDVTTMNMNSYYAGDINRINASTLAVNGTMESNIFEGAAATIDISEAAVINASGRGYAGGFQATGKGLGGGGGSATNGGGGAAHAAAGGNAATGGASGSSTSFGLATLPLTLGSGGGGGQSTKGGAGGGLIRLIASGTMTMDGSILVDGSNGANGSSSASIDAGGGGAGGSIWVAADTLEGSGLLSAVGGGGGVDSGGDRGGGGSGGYIRISYVTANTFAGTTAITGGTAGGGTATAGSDGTTITVNEATARHMAFVTDEGYNGNLAGLSGADTKCQAQAVAANLGGQWKAILSSGLTNASSRIALRGSIYNFSNALIADDAADYWDGTLDAAISHNAKGADQGAQNTWTASSSAGVKHTDHCTSWTTGAAGSSGLVGVSNVTGSTWVSSASNTCDQVRRLYCISQ